MNGTEFTESRKRRFAIEKWLPFYYGWINLILAVLVMVSALPSMTWGLGLVTEPLLQDLSLTRETWAEYNFYATAIATLCLLPAGFLVDRIGSKTVAITACCLLGLCTWLLGRVTTGPQLLVAMTWARVLGQSVLGVASVAMVGKWFYRRVSLAMTIYGILVILAYVLAERVTGQSARHWGWRATWSVWGASIGFGVTALLALFARSHPHQDDALAEAERIDTPRSDDIAIDGDTERSYTLWQAAATPIFWVFCLAGAANGGSQAVVSLFGISILQSNGLEDGLSAFLRAIATISSFAAIAGVLLTGVLSKFCTQVGLVTIACALGFASSLLLPSASSRLQADLFGLIWGMQCGVLMVVTNSVWAKYYGRQSQGAIEGFTMFVQSAAQAGAPWLMTRLTSDATSPKIFFYLLAALFLVLLFGAFALPGDEFERRPRRKLTVVESTLSPLT